MTTANVIVFSGPKDKTIADFWRMVWHEKINRVLMITMVMEDGKVCVLFVPLTDSFGVTSCFCVVYITCSTISRSIVLDLKYWI